ncbi:cysteate racemase [Haloechinothrix halophila]|uniref:aspartate/glutamate racemase family protein n=1 Tax=Haloechinothrix halophila TaxID=1069073 RepID=UPI0003F6A6AF|nr:amino acid racemase [Haloechinothrix halophila]
MRAPQHNLGVLGGMGPLATAEFLRSLAVSAPAATDQQHPRVLLLSEPTIPDRTEAVLTGDDAPLPALERGLLTLAGWGADLLAVPCNTAHVYLDRLRGRLPVPVVDIVDATLRESMRVSPAGGWLAASSGTVASGLYQRRAKALGYRVLVPDGVRRDAIHTAAVQVKANQAAEAGDTLREAVRSLWQRARLPVIGACTELPLAYAAADLPPAMMVSSLDALAQACVRRLYGATPPLWVGAPYGEVGEAA